MASKHAKGRLKPLDKKTKARIKKKLVRASISIALDKKALKEAVGE